MPPDNDQELDELGPEDLGRKDSLEGKLELLSTSGELPSGA